MAEKFDIYAHVTDSIVAAIEAGTAPWRKPWTGEAPGAAFPLRGTGEAYRGINVLTLWLTAMQRGFSSAYWLTFKQAKDLNAHVRKGEKSSTVVNWGQVERQNDDGEEVRFSFPKAYRVFDADQIEGLPESYYAAKMVEARDLGTSADPALDAYFAATGATIETTDTPQAYYHPGRDVVHMPPVRGL